MAKVAIIGLGNIGSNLVRQLGRFASIDSVVLIDPDVYEEKNIAGQDIMRAHVRQDKARVQADLLRAINGSLGIEAVVDEVQNVPWGTLRQCDVILGCLDNNLARQQICEICFRLGIPYVDAGIRKEGLFARVDVYVPGIKESSCMECSWSEADYNRLEVHYPCKSSQQPAATDSPLYLGSIAAAIQAAECAKILSGNHDNAGSRIVISADSYRSYISRIPANRECRFDHKTWDIEKIEESPDTLTIQQILDRGDGTGNDGNTVSLIFRKPFYLRSAHCSRCGNVVSILSLDPDVQLKCGSCNTDLTDSELRTLPGIDSTLPETVLEQTLASSGLRQGDIFSVFSSKGKRHFELGTCRNEKEDRDDQGDA